MTRRKAVPGPWADPTVKKTKDTRGTNERVFSGATWFKLGSWAGGNSRDAEPIWHLATANYRRGELYLTYRALCGYAIEQAILKDVRISKAQRTSSLPRGGWCKKCVKKETK